MRYTYPISSNRDTIHLYRDENRQQVIYKMARQNVGIKTGIGGEIILYTIYSLPSMNNLNKFWISTKPKHLPFFFLPFHFMILTLFMVGTSVKTLHATFSIKFKRLCVDWRNLTTRFALQVLMMRRIKLTNLSLLTLLGIHIRHRYM